MAEPTPLDPQIKLYSTFIPSPFPASPSFHLNLTHLTSTLFIWVGTSKPTDLPSGDGMVMSNIEAQAGPEERKLAGDWAVAMPSYGTIPATGTPIFRSGASDIALPMAQRLAKRFPKNQVHLSLSLPAPMVSSSGPSLDPYASKSILVMEKKLVSWLTEVLGSH